MRQGHLPEEESMSVGLKRGGTARMGDRCIAEQSNYRGRTEKSQKGSRNSQALQRLMQECFCFMERNSHESN